MAGKIIIDGATTRKKMLKGIETTVDLAARTYGPRGRLIAYNKGNNTKTTKDGISVIKEVELADEAEDAGVKFIKDISDKSNKQGGDGSTSVSILAGALCRAAYNKLQEGIDINSVRDGFRIASKTAVAELEKHKKLVESDDDIRNIARISANNDDEMASIVADAFTQIGDNGVVSIVDSLSKTGKTDLKVSQGFQIDAGFCTQKGLADGQSQWELENPIIMLFSEPLDDDDAVKLMMKPFYEGTEKRPFFIAAPDYSDEIRAYFEASLTARKFQGCYIRVPGTTVKLINDRLQDISVMTQSKIVGKDIEFSIFNYKKHAGKCEKLVCDKLHTVFNGTPVDDDVLDKYIADLEAQTTLDEVDKALSSYEIDIIKDRIAKMTGGIATIYVGALTEAAVGEKKDRYTDAVNAVRAALNGGYIAGAGTCLLRISYKKYNELKKSMTADVRASFDAYMRALRAPAKRLITSAGEDPEVIIPEILADENLGFDAKAAEVVNLFERGIIDPFNVIRNSLIYSAEGTETYMSVDGMIISSVKNLSYEPLDPMNDDRLFGGN